MSNRAVIVGASLAGLRAAEGLRHSGHEGPIVVVGDEPHAPYDRPPLSKQVLTGKAQPESTALRHDEDIDVEWMLGTRATGLDVAGRRVRLAEGGDLGYDSLVIATGAHPRRIPSAPAGPGVHYLRTLEDSVSLRDGLARASRVVVIGAGFIGLEVASSAKALGLEVTVVEALPVPLERALGPQLGLALAAWHRSNGVDIRLGAALDRIEGSGRPEEVVLTDGSSVPADLVVVGVGVAPTTAWLEGSGVDLDDGVVCDACLRVLAGGRPLPDVVAAGDVARWWHPLYEERVRQEHWTSAANQGEHAARTLMLGEAAEPCAPVPYVWSDQHGAKLQFVGRVLPGDRVEMLEGSVEEGRFLAGYERGGRLVAALGARRPAKVMALQQQIAAGATFPPDL